MNGATRPLGLTHNFSDDPTGRTFVSGNGTGGSTLDLFRFFFSVLPGDSNQNGVVNSGDTSGTIADVDGDGDGDNRGCCAINGTYMYTFLPGSPISR